MRDLKYSFSTQAANSDLIDNQDMLEVVTQEANQLLEDLRQVEGFDIDGVEEELNMVKKQWDQALAQSEGKQQVCR